MWLEVSVKQLRNRVLEYKCTSAQLGENFRGFSGFFEVGLFKLLTRNQCTTYSRLQWAHPQFGEAGRIAATEAKSNELLWTEGSSKCTLDLK